MMTALTATVPDPSMPVSIKTERRPPAPSVLEPRPPAVDALVDAGQNPAPDGEMERVRAAARGDVQAFEMLYREHVNRVYGLCCRLLNGDVQRAEQATQDAFVRAWERLSSFRGESQFSTWLHRLTVNVVLGEHRLLRRWVTFEETQPDSDSEASAAELDAGHPQLQTGLRIDLERALAKLPPGARAALILHDVQGYRHDEIARLTGIAVGTSKAQLHRARKLMREWLS